MSSVTITLFKSLDHESAVAPNGVGSFAIGVLRCAGIRALWSAFVWMMAASGAAQGVGGSSAAIASTPAANGVREIELTIIAQRLDCDTTGKLVAVFGRPKDEPGARDWFDVPTVVEIRRLADGALLNRAAVDGRVRYAWVDPSGVNWTPEAVNVVHRLSVKTGAKPIERPLSQPLLGQFPIGETNLATVLAHPDATRLTILDRSTLEPVRDHPLAKFVMPGHPADQTSWHNGAFLGDDEMLFAGRVIDSRSGDTQCFVTRPHNVMSVSSDGEAPMNLSLYGRFHWRRQFDHQDVVRKFRSPPLFNLESPTWDVSLRRPIVIVLAYERSDRGFHAVIRDLVYGKPLQTIDFSKSIGAARGGRPQGPTVIRFAGDAVVVASGDKLSVAKIDSAALSAVEPVRQLHPKLPIASVEERQTAPLSARGGDGSYVFEVDVKSRGIGLSPDGGSLEIDWPALWNALLRDLADGKRSDVVWQADHRDEEFIRFVGVKPDGDKAFVSAPITLKVSDRSGQADSIDIVALAWGPRRELDAALAKARDNHAKRMQQRADKLQGNAVTSDRNEMLETRLQGLEARMENIENQLDQILDELNRRPPSKESD